MASLAAVPADLTRPLAVRFLQHATFGGTPADVERLMSIGVDAWFTEQFDRQPAFPHFDRQLDGAADELSRSTWERYLGGEDQLRSRLTYALSQIFVVSRRTVPSLRVAAYADMLEANAFGTYRNLLEQVTRSGAMGKFLSYNRNQREDRSRRRVPDENFAREVMQLFSIGLWELEPDGTRKQDGAGNPIPAYGQEDVLGLARVVTGFESPNPFDDPELNREPMSSTGRYAELYHERGEKRFLGVTIPATADRTLDESLEVALDTLANHPNTAPFISRQLIQRLVTSNPSRAYVGRVAAVFTNDGSGTRGNLFAVCRAILTDDEAWQPSPPETHGKLREPALRLTTVLRAMSVSSPPGISWGFGILGDEATRLGQQPFEAPSVFNFYRPGYVPPQSAIGAASLTAPEMQIVNETSTIGWMNYLSRVLRAPIPRQGVVPEYEIDELIDLVASKDVSAAQANALVDEVEARLCPFGVSASVREIIVRKVREISDRRYDDQVAVREFINLDRVFGAVVMIAVSTDFLYER